MTSRSAGSAAITINVPDDLLEALNRRAVREDRSAVTVVFEAMLRAGLAETQQIPDVPRAHVAKKRTQLCLPVEVVAALKARSAASSTTLSGWIAKAVADFLGSPSPTEEVVEIRPAQRASSPWERSGWTPDLHPITGNPWVPVSFQGDSKWPYGKHP